MFNRNLDTIFNNNSLDNVFWLPYKKDKRKERKGLKNR